MNNVYFMVVRYNGLKKNVFKFIFKTIARYTTIDIKAIYNIKWSEEEKEERLLSFYEHIDREDAIKNIMQVNGLIMVGVVLYDNVPVRVPNGEKVSGKNWNMIQIKRRVRNKFGNVIHLSDSSDLAYREIGKLLGLNTNQVMDLVVTESNIDIKEITTDNDLAMRFNRIQEGAKILWKPKK